MNTSQREASACSLEEFLARAATLMPRLCRAMVRHEENYITRGELTLPQYLALELLHAEGAMTMTGIIEALRLKASTGTVFVDRLVRTRLVRRTRTEEDRRIVRVALTAKGERALEEIHSQKRKGMAEVFQKLSGAERAQYLSLMEKLVGDLSTEERMR